MFIQMIRRRRKIKSKSKNKKNTNNINNAIDDIEIIDLEALYKEEEEKEMQSIIESMIAGYDKKVNDINIIDLDFELYRNPEKSIIENLKNSYKEYHSNSEILNLDFDLYRNQEIKKFGTIPLDIKQKEDLQGFYESIRNDVKITKDILDKGIYNIIFKVASALYKNTKIIGAIAIAIIAITLAIPYISSLRKVEYVITDIKTVPYTGSIISVNINNETNKLELQAKNISINTGTQFLNSSFEEIIFNEIAVNKNTYEINNISYEIPKELHLQNIDIKNNYIYIQYVNDNITASKEIIWANEKPSSIDTTTLVKKGERFFEKSGPLQLKTCMNSYDNSFMLISETLSGGELRNTSLMYNIMELESNITRSQLEEETEIILEIDEIGSIKLSEIEEVNEAPEIIYDYNNDIIRIHNSNDNIDYVYIYEINNSLMNYDISNLVETGNERIYINENFNNQESNDYKTILILGDTNVYCIKINNIANNTLLYNILKQLNLSIEPIDLDR